MSRNRFTEKFKIKSNSELKHIILEEEKYDSEAVIAAKELLIERKVNFNENQKKVIENSSLNKLEKKNKTQTDPKEHTNQYLQIFVQQKTFPISNENIILILLLTLSATSYFVYNLNNLKNAIFESLGAIFTLITFIYFVILIISLFFRHERLQGKLKGRLIFEKDKIHIADDSFNIIDIKEIIIENWYVKGNPVDITTPTLKPKKSNGVKNYVKLYFENDTIITCYFLQTKTDKIQKFSEIFKSYYNLGLLTKQNYINITET